MGKTRLKYQICDALLTLKKKSIKVFLHLNLAREIHFFANIVNKGML